MLKTQQTGGPDVLFAKKVAKTSTEKNVQQSSAAPIPTHSKISASSQRIAPNAPNAAATALPA